LVRALRGSRGFLARLLLNIGQSFAHVDRRIPFPARSSAFACDISEVGQRLAANGPSCSEPKMSSTWREMNCGQHLPPTLENV
jgi:hypothetical protein